MSRILIIDDEKDLVSLLDKKLKKNGHEVLTANDGEEGMKLAAHFPDLILLDIMMPKMNGFEVLSFINKQQWNEHLL